MRLSVIPIVRAGGFGALPQLLEERAGEKTMLDVFERESLPIALRDAPTTPIPLLSMMNLFTRSGRQLGQRTLGLDVGAQMTHRAYGLWVEYCTQAPTLGEALQRVVTHCWAHVSGGVMELAAERDRRVLRFVVPDLGVPHIQHSDHLVPPMIMMMRHYLGKDWLPDWVEINYPRDPDAALMEDWLQVPVHFGGRGSGIAFGADVLSLSRDRCVPLGCRVLTLRDVAADIALKDAPEPARALSAAIALRLLDGRCDIDSAAQLVGLSVQGLQRRLRNKGFNYREILDSVRHERAVALLTETDLPVLEVALGLGYEDHSNFTRAFSRWTGMSPSAFRRMLVARSLAGQPLEA